MPRWLTRVQERIPLIRKSAAAKVQRSREWVRRNPRTALLVAGVTVAVALLVLLITHWNPYKAQREAFAPLFTLTAGLAIAGVTLMRHFAQTEADRQRRITESFSKAIEQLGSDKLEVRLGGIYALERISQESPQDHWTVMENLTAFVRERTQRAEADRRAKPLHQRVAEIAHSLWEEAGEPDGRSEEFWHAAVNRETSGEPPATDIAAVLTVIKRRSETLRAREIKDQRVLDFRQAVLRRADLTGAHLEGADLTFAHLEGAVCIGAGLRLEGAKSLGAYLERMGAHLEGANLWGAHLEGALLAGAHLQRVICIGAYLEGANLLWAHLDGADLAFAHLEYANLSGTHLDGAQLWAAEGLTQAQIDEASGDAETQLPAGLTRPTHWTTPAEDSAAPAR